MPVNSFDNYPLTWKPDKSTLKPPWYKSLAADLETKIRSGALQAGTKLPPQREIADYLDLNYTTITRIYDICKKKGLVYGSAGKGTFVAPHSNEDITITASGLNRECIELGAVNGFSEHSELAEKAARSVVEKGYLRNLFSYSHPTGHPHQLAAGVRWMEQLGIHTDCEHTAIFAGAQNALAVVLISLFSPGDKLAVDQYTYSNLIELAKLLHIVLVPVAGDADGMRPEELEKQCSTNKIRGVYLMPACANPTSIFMPLERRGDLASIIRRHGLILLEDDVSAWLSAAGGETVPTLFDMLPEQSVYICGMTKSLCPGLRVAYTAFAEQYREKIQHGLFNVNIKTSSLDAEIITELILNGDAYKIAAHKRKLAEKACKIFYDCFPAFHVPPAHVGYYKWIPLYVQKPYWEVEQELADQGVRVYHSERFTVAENPAQNYLRVALCSAGSMPRLEKGLWILRKYLDEQRSGLSEFPRHTV